jgi:hypothetical protein
MRRHNPLFFLKSKATYRSLVLNLALYLLSVCFVLPVHSQRPQPSAVPTPQESVGSPQKEGQRKGDDAAEMRKTITRLRAENERLRKRVASLQQIGTFSSIQELLAKEEQRANNLQTQLSSTMEKMASLESRMDEINEQLRPENIERMVVQGSLRPEEVREATSRRLSGEKRRLQSQLDLLQPTRSRLQASLMGTEQTIQRLQLQLQDTLRK